jgi:hypothetical protein
MKCWLLPAPARPCPILKNVAERSLSALRSPRFDEGHEKEGEPGALQKIRAAERWLFFIPPLHGEGGERSEPGGEMPRWMTLVIGRRLPHPPPLAAALPMKGREK